MASALDFFENLYASAQVPILVTDEKLNQIYANPKMEELLDLVKEEFTLLTPSVREEGLRCLQNMRMGEGFVAAGPHSLDLSLTPYPFGGKNYLVLQPIKEASPLKEAQLVRIYRNYHEKLISLLNEIYGEARQENNLETQSAVRRIVRMNNHLYEMVDGSGKHRYIVPIDLQAFIETYVDAYKEIDPQAPICCLEETEPILGKVMPEDLEIILGNLISNALRFGKGRVTLWTERKGEKVSIVVGDNGNGVKDPSTLFLAGFSAPDQKGVCGIGFGLYVSKKLAELQGATLHYERRGEEICFRFETDRADLPAGRLAAWKAEDFENSLSQIRIEMSEYEKESEL